MKCPHCGKVHPDDFNVCPYTAKPIEPQLQYCKNEGCNFRSPLPLSAKFCPNCGKELRAIQSSSSLSSCIFSMETTSRNCAEDFRKFKFFSDEGTPLSDKEFFIVSETIGRSAYHDYYCHYQFLLLDSDNNCLCYLDAKGILTTLGDYSEVDGYRVGKDEKRIWRYEAKIMNERYILYRDGIKYIFYEIGEDGIPLPKHKFSSKLYSLHEAILIGEYINFNEWSSSVRLIDGKFVKIADYHLCKCIAYDNNSPIFAVTKLVRDIEFHNECEIVTSKGELLWFYHCNFYTINASYNNLIKGADYDQGSALFTAQGEKVLSLGSRSVERAINSDILELSCSYTYFSCYLKQECIEYGSRGEYYRLIEKLSSNYRRIYIMKEGNGVVYSLKTHKDEKCDLLKTTSNQYAPILENSKGEIINLINGQIIYNFNPIEESCVGVSLSASRFAMDDGSVIKIIDFNGRILNTILRGEINIMCSNGYIVMQNRDNYELKYYDLECTKGKTSLPNPHRRELKCDLHIDMIENDFIIVNSLGFCIIKTMNGNLFFEGREVMWIYNNIYYSGGKKPSIINLRKKIIIKGKWPSHVIC